MTKPEAIEKFFNEFNANTIDKVYEFYDKDIEFADPVGSHKGVESVKKYYQELYKNVDTIHFEFTNHVCEKDQCVSVWVMHLKAKKLNGDKEIAVQGNSVFKFNAQDKVIYHRDYFDMGEFIYERIPLLKNVISFIKKKMSAHD